MAASEASEASVSRRGGRPRGPPGSQAQDRRWVFTINNPEGPLATDGWKGRVRVAAWQRERGAEGTEHFQGFLVLAKNSKMHGVEVLLGGRAHLEQARGTHSQCLAYVTKDETRVEGPWFYPTEEEARRDSAKTKSDRDACVQMIVEGKTLYSVATEAPAAFVQFHGGLKALQRALLAPRKRDSVTVVCIHGPPGIGKTTYVWDHFEDVFVPKVTESGAIWFDGYQGQKYLLLEDYNGQLPIHEFNAICDRNPYRAPVKGGMTGGLWTHVFINTNIDPKYWYQKYAADPDVYGSVLRRVGYGDYIDRSKDIWHHYVYCRNRDEMIAGVTHALAVVEAGLPPSPVPDSVPDDDLAPPSPKRPRPQPRPLVIPDVPDVMKAPTPPPLLLLGGVRDPNPWHPSLPH